MNDDTTDLDQADEEILTYTVSDEALEAAAGMDRGLWLRADIPINQSAADQYFDRLTWRGLGGERS